MNVNPALICPTDRIQRHHHDKERKHCTVCGARIYDTVHGWMTMTPRGA